MCRGPKFGSKYATFTPGHPTPSSGLLGICSHVHIPPMNTFKSKTFTRCLRFKNKPYKAIGTDRSSVFHRQMKAEMWEYDWSLGKWWRDSLGNSHERSANTTALTASEALLSHLHCSPSLPDAPTLSLCRPTYGLSTHWPIPTGHLGCAFTTCWLRDTDIAEALSWRGLRAWKSCSPITSTVVSRPQCR